MAFKYLETATCHFIASDTTKQFPSFEEAVQAAEQYCGNKAYAKPFPKENTRFYGPGNGDTTVMVRQDVSFTR